MKAKALFFSLIVCTIHCAQSFHAIAQCTIPLITTASPYWTYTKDFAGSTYDDQAYDIEPVDDKTSPVTITLASATYEWSVQANCSPHVASSTTVTGTNFSVACKIKGADADDGSETLTISPNPNSGAFNLALQIPGLIDGEAIVTILDGAGKILLTRKLPVNGSVLDETISEFLPSGFYLVQIFAEGKTYQSKLIIANP